MRLTENSIKKAQNLVSKYLLKNKRLGNKSQIYKIAKNFIRDNIYINYNTQVYKNVEFIYDNINKHWAETDGIKIYINIYNDFSFSLLYFTLLHETLHGIIIRNNKYEISEYKEHKIMENIDERLIK